jgi:hypothetical protein
MVHQLPIWERRMIRAERFLQLHKELETQLRSRLHLPKTLSYSALLDQITEAGDTTIRQNYDFLRSMGDLRNILSHVSLGMKYIAEPTQDALEKFEAIANRITQPTLVRDVANKPVKVFEETDTLLAALTDMKINDYSQIVIRRTGQLRLIGPEGITQLLLQESNGVGLLEPATAPVSDVGAHEPKASCRFMKPDQTVDEARTAFLDGSAAPSTRLYAILITHTAKPTEIPLGIVTPWDVFDP